MAWLQARNTICHLSRRMSTREKMMSKETYGIDLAGRTFAPLAGRSLNHPQRFAASFAASLPTPSNPAPEVVPTPVGTDATPPPGPPEVSPAPASPELPVPSGPTPEVVPGGPATPEITPPVQTPEFGAGPSRSIALRRRGICHAVFHTDEFAFFFSEASRITSRTSRLGGLHA